MIRIRIKMTTCLKRRSEKSFQCSEPTELMSIKSIILQALNIAPPRLFSAVTTRPERNSQNYHFNASRFEFKNLIRVYCLTISKEGVSLARQNTEIG